jgi:hypothetical protein
MNTDAQKYNPQLQLVAKVLPHGARENFVRDMNETPGTPLQLAIESAAFIPIAYWTHAVRAFNKYSSALALLLVIFCFGMADLSTGAVVLLLSVLGALALRDGYLHNVRPKENMPPVLRHCLDSMGDAVTAGLFSLISQLVLMEVSPRSILPAPILWRGGVVCLSLIFTLKMMFRIQPDPNAPFSTGDIEPSKICRQVRRLTLLWIFTFCGLVALNVTDIPNYWPDRLRGWLVLVSFAIWFVSQRDWFGRLKIRTLFMDSEKAALEQKLRFLAKGLKYGEPMYWGYLAMDVVIHLQVVFSIIDSVLPWLTRHSPHASLVQALGAITSGTVVLLTWSYVKQANRSAALALVKVTQASA